MAHPMNNDLSRSAYNPDSDLNSSMIGNVEKIWHPGIESPLKDTKNGEPLRVRQIRSSIS